MLRLKKIGVAVVATTALATVSVGSAFAGEITGNGKWIAGSETAPLNGKSDCAYSGVNDNYVLGNPVPDADGFTRTQSWGQVIRTAGPLGGVPGTACNPARAGE
ncbi:MAG TPA: hypothetical protein VMR48_05150 [Gaiellaceae bacterium]|jgi:hypothetical protein|nr:hypothetical protein [Gaiellaceae bacterium]